MAAFFKGCLLLHEAEAGRYVIFNVLCHGLPNHQGTPNDSIQPRHASIFLAYS
jgi:hypothetical protein